MQTNLRLDAVHSADIAPDLAAAVHAFCHRAHDEDLTPLFATFVEAAHVLAFLHGTLASHAMRVTRWLQPGDAPLLRTAYVEMVATEPCLQRRGLASAVTRRLASEISAYDMGALCPAEPELYAGLGWVFWRGPLFIRPGQTLIPTPDERVMILRLPGTPVLDPNQPLSAEWREGELW